MTESKITTQEFHDNHYRDAHEAYVRWLRYHPSGFVLNQKATTFAVLHKSDCMHIVDYPDLDYSLTAKRKVCAPSSAPLERWAKEHGIEWTYCGTCLGS
jgi:hypothetical protein